MLAVRFIDPIRYSCETAHHRGSDRRCNHVYHSSGRPMDVGRNRSGCDGRNREPELDNRYSGPIDFLVDLRGDYRQRDLFSAHRSGIVLGTASWPANSRGELARFSVNCSGSRQTSCAPASRISCTRFSFPWSFEPLRYRARGGNRHEPIIVQSRTAQ